MPSVADDSHNMQPAQSAGPSRWESLVWPQWLPIRARLPLLAQICGVAALLAAVAMPNLADAPAPYVAAVAAAKEPAPEAPSQALPPRSAHLNLDVRHNFKSVTVTVTIDDERAFDARLEGSGKKFGVFGKREERGHTRTFDLEPGVRVVRVRVHSAADKFDQTRVERFELGPAAVASLRLVVEKAGLAVFADRPPIVQPPTPAPRQAALLPVPSVPDAPSHPPAPRGVIAELYLTMRSVLIAVAGFVATTAAGFVVQEFLISRKRLLGL